MTFFASIPLLVSILGAVLYLVVKRPDVKQLALYAFACGLLVALFAIAGHTEPVGRIR